ncbi:hypothetical protein [Pedobacter nutrimenti]|uniref:hypothetical protein n=1 Tax=Pedobacter nutrimenti TaxID=1241337 RepID=UPI002930C116|nr:hypothetical protein [Pedobacter nutrimenti]
MDGIFILNDNANEFSQKIIHEIEIKSIEYYDLRTDKDIDTYVTKIFEHNTIDKLLIPVSLGEEIGNNMGIRIALHIRFSANIGKKHLLPIILISDSSLETLLIDQENKYALIATTDGCVLSPQDIDEIRSFATYTLPANEINFNTNVLGNLIIKGPETIGSHSMANEWGVVQLDRIANLNSLDTSAPALEKKVSLYFKYLSSINRGRTVATSIGSSIALSTPNTIPSYERKILYIDDEGYKGWTLALEKIFRGGRLTVITGEHLSEVDFLEKISSEINKDWDLILLDLRLLPLKEDITGQVHPIGDYSGTKKLKEIKAINEGLQIIIFTASNKAWNMRDLIDLGADGYYIKESPEYLIPDHLSLLNYESFKKQVQRCFGRDYLRKLYIRKEAAINNVFNPDSDFLTYSKAALNEFFKLIKLDMRESAFLTLFLPIEQYTEAIVTDAPHQLINLSGAIVPLKIGNSYKMVRDGVNKCFQIQNSTSKISLTKGLGKISFAMAFKYSKNDIDLINIGRLVGIRNNIAHGSAVTITTQDYEDLIAIIELFRSNN